MPDYTLSARTIPLDDSWDVVVIGGGPAGCTAAVAAAREGARTLLIESTGALGGMGTSGLVPAWCPFTDQEKIIYAGLAERVLKETMAVMPHVSPERYDWTPIDPEALKRVYDDLVTGAGAELRFMASVVAVEASADGAVAALILASKAGLTAVKAKVYVDCTGDGDVATWAGADIEKGDEDGALQPATLCFILSNVDMYAYQHICGPKHHPKFSAIGAITASGKYPEIPDQHACNATIGPGTVGFNAGHVWRVDNTDPASVSMGLVKGRKIARAFRDALAEFCAPAFGNAFLVSTGALLGIRETRRIIGDYMLTLDDFLTLRSFPDEICRNCYFIDVHHKRAEIGTEKEDAGTAIHLGRGESHGIPYRCLTPRGLTNVLVAGRCISTTREVQGSTRVMPVCLCMGEAAGVAAHMAATGRQVDVHAVDTDDLRGRLRKHGAYLP